MSVDFLQVQQGFWAWVRDPTLPVPDGVQPARMAVYRELLFNNISGFIDVAYPIARSRLPPTQWLALQQEFFAQAACSSPLYVDISLHFREYLTDIDHPVLITYPWLHELLHVEWLDLYVDRFVALDLAEAAVDPTVVQLRFPAWVLVYQWPVWQWREGQTPETPMLEPHAVLVWRDATHQQHLEPISPIAALLLEPLTEQQSIPQHVWLTLLSQAVPQATAEQYQLWQQQVQTWLIERELWRPALTTTTD